VALFFTQIKQALKNSVSTGSLKVKIPQEPLWFNKTAKKLVTKHRRTYNLYKKTKNFFYLNKYDEERRAHKKELSDIQQNYIFHKICKPSRLATASPSTDTLNGHRTRPNLP